MIFSSDLLTAFTLFILKIFVDFISALGPPEISIDESQKIAFGHLGSSVTLRCPVKTPPGSYSILFIDWKRGDESLYLEDRFKISERGTLKIRPIRVNDEGLYSCCATNGYGSVVINVSLIVYGPPIEVEDSKNQSLAHPKSLARIYGAPKIEMPSNLAYIGEIGSTLSIKCAASGVPYPAVFWLKNGDLQQGTSGRKRTQEKWTSVLNIKITQYSDAGVYTCVAKNEHGTDKLDFSVQVRDPLSPPAISLLQPPNITVSSGETAVFWCEVKSNTGLKLMIKWLKSVTNQELQMLNRTFWLREQYYKPLESNDVVMTSDGTYKAKMVLSKTRSQDSGTYLCLAVNDKGYTVKNATLLVIPSAPGMTEFHMTSVTTHNYLASVMIAVIAITLTLGVFCIVYKCRNTRNALRTEITTFKPEVRPLQDETLQKSNEIPRCHNNKSGDHRNNHLISTPTVKAVEGTSYYQIPTVIERECCFASNR